MEHVLLVMNNGIAAVCQFLAMIVILIGVMKALSIFLRDVLTPGRSVAAVKQSRMEMGHSFSLGLGFLIGASILKTTLAPTWTDIGQLSAIIAIRTVLNYFLLREVSTGSSAPKTSKAGLGIKTRPTPVENEAPIESEAPVETREPVMAT